MDKIYNLIEELYNNLSPIDGSKVYIVPHDTMTNKVGDTYITYKVLTSYTGDLHKEIGVEKVGKSTYRTLHKNYQSTISFNVVSKSQAVSLSIASELHDLLTYTLSEEIYSNYNLTILEVTPIRDVTTRITDTYSYRYNLDLRLRGSKTIKRKVGSIESANVNWRYE